MEGSSTCRCALRKDDWECALNGWRRLILEAERLKPGANSTIKRKTLREFGVNGS
jgi:hypothetical protein